MFSLRSSLRAGAVAVIAGAALSACVVAPLGYDADGEPVAYADVPPPAPYVEVRPAVPFAGAVWIGGYWGWRGGRHHWVPGHYVQPRPGYVWRPYHWAPRGPRWALSGGVWVRPR